MSSNQHLDNDVSRTHSTPKLLAAGIAGNLLEWFDFAIYGFFAVTIGKLFFPDADPVAQVIASFGVFAVGFLMRPVGGVVLGHIGDKHGRQTAMVISVAAMAIPTFLVGVLPTYATLGIAAPILLLLLRMVQGLSVGGEYTTSIIYMIEHTDKHKRGLIGSFAAFGAIGGMLLGSGFGAVPCCHALRAGVASVGLACAVFARVDHWSRRPLSAPRTGSAGRTHGSAAQPA